MRANVKSMDNKANDFKIQSSVVTSSVRGTELQDSALGEHATLRGTVYSEASSYGWGMTTTEGETTELYDGVMKNTFTNGNNDVVINKKVQPPLEEESSPLQITTGDYGLGLIHLPAVGFFDTAGLSAYEKELYNTTVTVTIE